MSGFIASRRSLEPAGKFRSLVRPTRAYITHLYTLTLPHCLYILTHIYNALIFRGARGISQHCYIASKRRSRRRAIGSHRHKTIPFNLFPPFSHNSKQIKINATIISLNVSKFLIRTLFTLT